MFSNLQSKYIFVKDNIFFINIEQITNYTSLVKPNLYKKKKIKSSDYLP